VTERPTPDDEQRDAAIDVAWRRSSDEEPSLAVDEAIRAAARRRIGSRPRGDERSADSGRRWTQWAPVAAAAGVAVLAFGLLRWLPVEQQFAPSAPVSPSAGTETARDAAAEESAAAPAAPPAQTRPLSDEPASAPSDAAIPAPPAADSVTRQKQAQPAPVQERRELPSVSEPTTAEGPAEQSSTAPAPAAPASGAQDAGATAPEDETTVSVTSARSAARQDASEQVHVEEITKLYAAGQLDAAAAALRKLRSTDPHADARLPQELRSWAATVRD